MHNAHRRILDNMQILHECWDSRNDHMQTRTRLRSRGNAEVTGVRRAAGTDLEDVDMNEVLDHLKDIDRMSSRKQEEAAREAQERLSNLANAGFFSTLVQSQLIPHWKMALWNEIKKWWRTYGGILMKGGRQRGNLKPDKRKWMKTSPRQP